mmetsp:Transcript_8044/g.14260  ORF Transcript_8044/g.14260 Transcript_8044/m.14260 type:complete len:81 (+) Transcript_8044:66-308(+)|eukprot:CAMPEP_0184512636 /NCGR_PEP_ID=MMETSP0198_2-20121128/2987_1 /TAXON_ID=1112570 /ORGANISM="Thraustochytrium sp., Strain LLF1b" /LENGTH=80 /DNA_ID=CAMNT_0026902675 /DNA_START=456 /DNA_END=698 /DNA_ORIENTATION=-
MIATLARTAVRSAPVARATQSRSLVTATKPKLGGGEDHRVFKPPFSKLSAAVVVFGVVGAGFFVPLYSVKYQNKKHGFTK